MTEEEKPDIPKPEVHPKLKPLIEFLGRILAEKWMEEHGIRPYSSEDPPRTEAP